MKRFIITNLLAIMTLPMLACIWVSTHNYYLFSAYESNGFSDHVEEVCNNNWKAYLGKSESDYYYFNAPEIIEAAKAKNDQLMVTYVQNLQKYLDCVDIEQRKQFEWNYPTADEINQCNQTLRSVRQYAFGKTRSRLRSQHALLYMRCNMMLGEHSENITFWEQSASQFINSIYKDMMKNIYAGALYKTGQEDKAGEMFAEMGDYNSLMTLYYKKRSYLAIRKEYMQNPNSKVLPFLLQDFVNNAQEAKDGEESSGKLFIRPLTEAEVWQMRNLCDQVIKEGKTKTPVLWKSAKAWLEYMFGDKLQALADITEAQKMNGTERMKDNARVLYIYINSAVGPQGDGFDEWVAPQLEWLYDKGYSDNADWYYHRAYDRLLHQVLVNTYEQKNRPEIAVALLKGGDFSYYSYVDTMAVESLLRYEAYTREPAKTALDRFLKRTLATYEDEYTQNVLYDLIGTKFMRIHEWDKAINWLQRVPLSFYSSRGYAVYAHYRSTSVEPWIKRQFLKESVEYSDARYTFNSNPKIDFAKEIMTMEGELNVLKGDAQQQRYYDLAVRFAQAHFTGDCWYLLRDSKSVSDTIRVNEFNFSNRAVYYLEKASTAKDFKLKEKALFALAYSGLYTTNWYEYKWNAETSDWDRIVNDWTPQYKAFTKLADLEKKNASNTSPYVSHCDEYIQFLKSYAKR